MAEIDTPKGVQQHLRAVVDTLKWTTGFLKLEAKEEKLLPERNLFEEALAISASGEESEDEPDDVGATATADEPKNEAMAAAVETVEPENEQSKEVEKWAEQYVGAGGENIIVKLICDASNNQKALGKHLKTALGKKKSKSKDMVKATLKKVVEGYQKHKEEKTLHLHASLTDLMAQLIYLVPTVAGTVLDLLLDEDEINQEMKDEKDLKNHIRIKGVFMNDPMKCVYAGKEQWKNKVELLRRGRDPDVYEVRGYKCLLPNVLDLDLIQAMAYTNNVEIFAKKSVQAILYCAWRKLMVHAVKIQTFLALVDLLSVLAWGMTTEKGSVFDRLLWNETHDDKDPEWLKENGYSSTIWQEGSAWEHVYAYGSPRHAPSVWNILAASTLRQFINFVWKTCSWHQRQQAAMEAQTKSGLQFMGYIWGHYAYFQMILNADLFLFFSKLIFLCFTFGRKEEVMTGFEQAALSGTFSLTLIGLLSPFRVVACKVSLSLMAIKRAVVNPDVLHFFTFLFVMFSFFMFAWGIVDRENTLLCAFVQGFRGLVVGDGDGMDLMGMKTDDETVQNDEAHKFKAAFGILGMILFFSYLMNLLIAIFSNTYEEADKMVWLYFHQARAQDLRENILGLHKFRRGGHFMMLMDKLNLTDHFEKPKALYLGIAMFGVGFVIQFGVHLLPEHIFVREWVFYVTTLVSIILLTLGATFMEASVYAPGDGEQDWFPAEDNPTTDHYMYVFCRSDFDSNLFLGTEELDREMEEAQRRVKKMHDKIDNLTEVLKECLPAIPAPPKEEMKQQEQGDG